MRSLACINTIKLNNNLYVYVHFGYNNPLQSPPAELYATRSFYKDFTISFIFITAVVNNPYLAL